MIIHDFRSFSTLPLFHIVSGFAGPPATSSGLVHFAQDFAPPKPLVDVLVEKSPALTVKLWGKVQYGPMDLTGFGPSDLVSVWLIPPNSVATLRGSYGKS